MDEQKKQETKKPRSQQTKNQEAAKPRSQETTTSHQEPPGATRSHQEPPEPPRPKNKKYTRPLCFYGRGGRVWRGHWLVFYTATKEVNSMMEKKMVAVSGYQSAGLLKSTLFLPLQSSIRQWRLWNSSGHRCTTHGFPKAAPKKKVHDLHIFFRFSEASMNRWRWLWVTKQ